MVYPVGKGRRDDKHGSKFVCNLGAVACHQNTKERQKKLEKSIREEERRLKDEHGRTGDRGRDRDRALVAAEVLTFKEPVQTPQGI